MQWKELKAQLLESGSARLTGEPADRFIATSTAGPGAGGKGSVFFAMGNHRVKFAINPPEHASRLPTAVAAWPTCTIAISSSPGRLLEPGLHCPDQAFITVTGTCIFRCRVLSGPGLFRAAQDHR